MGVRPVRLLELGEYGAAAGADQPEADVQLRQLPRPAVDDLVLHCEGVSVGHRLEEALLLARLHVNCHLPLQPGHDGAKTPHREEQISR